MKMQAIRLVILLSVISQEGFCQNFPSLAEIHDFEPGDEFHVIHFYCCNELSFQLERTVVKERTYQGGELAYVNQRSIFDFLRVHPPVLVDTTLFQASDTLRVPYPDSVIFRPSDTAVVIPGKYNDRMVFIRSYWIENSIKEEWYVAGLGMVLSAWRLMPGGSCDIVDSMVYFRKGQETWGKTLLSATDHRARRTARIYPNPTGDHIILETTGPDVPILGVDILEATGRRVLTCPPPEDENTLRVSLRDHGLPRGVYFAYIRTPEGCLLGKFIKQ